ncbi:hypothetical protein [Sphingomonas sp.]|jgi:hypothetical protein|uniref:hypothetical protein n=1 Tax=Sphingomonas sp. TaxID=28214 RepID=UPI002EDA25AC
MNRLLIAAMLIAAPATAQQVGPPAAATRKPISIPGEISRSAPVNGVVVLYGNERCPTDGDGNEVVVCVRRSAQEQFRVPKELRNFQVTPQNESWAARAQGTMDTGVGTNSIGSCSVVGAGGQTGCFAQRVRESKREDAARDAEQARVP